jgi:hypothetical protein
VKSPRFPTATAIDFTDAERSTLLWALEIARALRLGDPDVGVLLADRSISAETLDELADRLVDTGQPVAGTDS